MVSHESDDEILMYNLSRFLKKNNSTNIHDNVIFITWKTTIRFSQELNPTSLVNAFN